MTEPSSEPAPGQPGPEVALIRALAGPPRVAGAARARLSALLGAQYTAGATLGELAHISGRSRELVRALIEEGGVAIRPPRTRVSHNTAEPRESAQRSTTPDTASGPDTHTDDTTADADADVYAGDPDALAMRALATSFRITGTARTALADLFSTKYKAGASLETLAAMSRRSTRLVRTLIDETGVTIRPSGTRFGSPGSTQPRTPRQLVCVSTCALSCVATCARTLPVRTQEPPGPSPLPRDGRWLTYESLVALAAATLDLPPTHATATHKATAHNAETDTDIAAGFPLRQDPMSASEQELIITIYDTPREDGRWPTIIGIAALLHRPRNVIQSVLACAGALINSANTRGVTEAVREEIIHLYPEVGHSYMRVADVLSMNPRTVYQILADAHVIIRLGQRRPHFLNVDETHLIELYQKHELSCAEIAARTGHTDYVVETIIRKAGVVRTASERASIANRNRHRSHREQRHHDQGGPEGPASDLECRE